MRKKARPRSPLVMAVPAFSPKSRFTRTHPGLHVKDLVEIRQCAIDFVISVPLCRRDNISIAKD